MTNGVNDQRFKDALAEVREIARTQAEGDRGKAVLAGRLVFWAADGVISSEKDKHGKGISDAKLIYEEHIGAYSRKASTQHTPAGKKVQAARCNTFIKFGEQVAVDPKAEFPRWNAEYKTQHEIDPKLVRPEFECYYNLAKEQLKNSDQPLSDEQIKELVMKPEKGEKDVLDELESIKKQLERLVSGECGVKDQHDLTIEAFHVIEARIAALMIEEKERALRATAAELGLEVVVSQAA
jgi:hypothetical protein